MNRTVCLIAVLLAALIVSPAVAQDTMSSAAQLKDLEAQRAKLESDVRAKLVSQLDALRSKLLKEPDLVELKAAYDKAEAAYEESKKTSPELVTARKAVDEASAAHRKAYDAAVAADPGLKELQDQAAAAKKAVDDADTKGDAADSGVRKARVKLAQSPEARPLADELAKADKAMADLRANNPAVQAAKRAAEQADKAYHDARRALPEYEALAKAEKAYEEKCRTLPEYKARNDAEKAYGNAIRNPEGIKDLEAQRSAAKAALDKKVDELMMLNVEAAAEVEKLKEATKAAADARQKRNEAAQKLRDAADAAAAKVPAVADARKAYSTAQKAYYTVYAEKTEPTRKARSEASQALDTKLKEKLAADAAGADLLQQLKDADAKIQDLRDKIRALRK